jgi:exosortase J
LLFHWAEYKPADGSAPIALGISPVLGSHDTLICHTARGDDPLWRDQLTVTMANSTPVSFSAALYNNGAVEYLEATTLCSGSHCGEYTSDRRSFGFVYSKPDPQALFSRDPQRPIPILLKAESLDATMLPEVARTRLSADMKAFLAAADFDALLQPYRRR